jgi:hypothetical protein
MCDRSISWSMLHLHFVIAQYTNPLMTANSIKVWCRKARTRRTRIMKSYNCRIHMLHVAFWTMPTCSCASTQSDESVADCLKCPIPPKIGFNAVLGGTCSTGAAHVSMLGVVAVCAWLTASVVWEPTATGLVQALQYSFKEGLQDEALMLELGQTCLNQGLAPMAQSVLARALAAQDGVQVCPWCAAA